MYTLESISTGSIINKAGNIPELISEYISDDQVRIWLNQTMPEVDVNGKFIPLGDVEFALKIFYGTYNNWEESWCEYLDYQEYRIKEDLKKQKFSAVLGAYVVREINNK